MFRLFLSLYVRIATLSSSCLFPEFSFELIKSFSFWKIIISTLKHCKN